MTTTTTFQGMEPGAKNSSRVLRPPGGDSSFTFGTDDNTTPQRKNKMASSIFAEPEDPHAHRRNNPPSGSPTGTLCGEPSAPLRRCQQPILFPKNPEPELITIHNSGAAMLWNQRREGENGQEQTNDECPDEAEQEEQDQQEQQKETPQPSAPSGVAKAAKMGRSPPIISDKIKDRVQLNGAFPNVDILIKNLTVEDTGPYWCSYVEMGGKSSDLLNVKSKGSVLLVVKGEPHPFIHLATKPIMLTNQPHHYSTGHIFFNNGSSTLMHNKFHTVKYLYISLFFSI
uniref:Immunoglobulin V-set domain-containing protein n=1 Tax=Monopterus albus TaxID=43700 RepID=A0A3Q3J466_MONAL